MPGAFNNAPRAGRFPAFNARGSFLDGRGGLFSKIITSTPSFQYFTDDAFANPYFTDDAKTNKYKNSGGTAAAFSPDTLPNLAAWWDASDASTITAAGGVVSQWNDKTANAHNFVQASGTKQPTTGTASINGKNALGFDGVNDLMTTNSFIYDQGKCTVYIVFNSDAANAGNLRLMSEGNTATTTSQYGWSTDVTNTKAFLMFIRDDANVAKPLNTGVHTISDGVQKIVRVVDNGVDQQNYVNGFLDGTIQYVRTASTFNTLAIGGLKRSTEGSWLKCNIGEILVFNEVHSAQQSLAVEKYLFAKWYQPVDVLFVIGQSNADGRGAAASLPAAVSTFYNTKRGSLYIYNKLATRTANTLDAASFDGSAGNDWWELHKTYSASLKTTHQVIGDAGAGVASGTATYQGVELAYGYLYNQAKPNNELFIFKGGIGGAGIELDFDMTNATSGKLWEWWKDYVYTPAYAQLVATGRTIGSLKIFWMQGETEATNHVSYASYYASLQKFVDRCNTEFFKVPDKIVIGGLSTHYDDSFGTAIKQAQIDVAAANPANCVLLRTDGTGADPAYAKNVDDIHYSAQGLYDLAVRLLSI